MPYRLAGAVTVDSSSSSNASSSSPRNNTTTTKKVNRWRLRYSNKRGSKSSIESNESSTSNSTTSTMNSSSNTSNTSYYSEHHNDSGDFNTTSSPIEDDDGQESSQDTIRPSLLKSVNSIDKDKDNGRIPQLEEEATNRSSLLSQGSENTQLSIASSTPSIQQRTNYHPGYRQSIFDELLSLHTPQRSSSLRSSSLLLTAPSVNTSLSASASASSSAARSSCLISIDEDEDQAYEISRPPLSPPDSSHASPLSSYNRPPLPGSPPGVPLSPLVVSLPTSSTLKRMTSLASTAASPSDGGRKFNNNDNRRGPQPIVGAADKDNADVSAQIMNLANMIVSPVPQRRIHVNEESISSTQPSTTTTSKRHSSLPPAHNRQQSSGPSHSNQYIAEQYEDQSHFTMEESQEAALSNGDRSMGYTSSGDGASSMSNDGRSNRVSTRRPLPSLPQSSTSQERPQSSFSIITNGNYNNNDQQHHSRPPRRDASSSSRLSNSEQLQSNGENSPPKPRLRMDTTSLNNARGRVSSFFGGISDSLSGSGSSNTGQQGAIAPISYSGRSPSPSSQQYLDATAYNAQQHQASSSYPSTSHMQPPLHHQQQQQQQQNQNQQHLSSIPQSRSQSQPLQHQQTIPQYAIPPSQPPISQQQQHLQHPSISSSSLHPASRSSFYGLDAHSNHQGGAESMDGQHQQQRCRSTERRASPSSFSSSAGGGGGGYSRPASQSIPRSDTGHYTSPSLGGASYSNEGGNNNNARRRVSSWATRSNASSVYGLNMASPQLAPSNSGDLLPPVPHLTQAHLRPGQGVSLLSHQKTLDMYRANVKKTNDPEVTFELVQFMLGLAREMAVQDHNNAQQYYLSQGGTTLHGVSEENLLSSMNHGVNDSSSPSPDPSFTFHSRSSGSSGDLQSAAVGASRTFSSQGLNNGNNNTGNGTGLSKRRGSSHSPSPSMSVPAASRLSAIGMNRTGSPTSNSGTANNNNDRRALVAEAISLLKRSADRGHVDSQFFLADIYANGGLETGSHRHSSVGMTSGVSRASIYALLPGGGGGGNNNVNAGPASNGTGSGNVSPMEMRMNPSPTGSAASLHNQATSFFNNAAPAGNSSSSPSTTTKPDYDKALPLFIAAAKHGHIPSCYRAGECFENGWGCRKDANKAVQFYRKSAASSFPEAMYRLGMAELNGELGLKDRQKEGFKWLKQVAALAESNNENNTQQNGASDGANGFSSSPSNGFGLDDSSDTGINQASSTVRQCTVQALHELALLHERGIHNVVFVDNEYAAELLARASELGYAPSAYKLGECYEYGKMGCPQDAALSIHYYNIAAQQNHREACFALTAWYLVGSPGVLPQSDTEAYLWAKKAAEQGLAKAEYAVGYFTEVGIGSIKDEREAIQWFTKAAEHGDKRAITRLRTLGVNTDALVSPPLSPRSAKTSGRPGSVAGSAHGGRRKGPRHSNVSRDQLNHPEMMDGAHPAPEGHGEQTPKQKRRSRRSTLPGIMGMSSKEERPPMPNGAGGEKKSETECIIS